MPTNEFTKENRTRHQLSVRAFLDREFSDKDWNFSLPHGWGTETYFAYGNKGAYFIKLGAPISNYEAMASLGLTPPVIASGVLEDGTNLLVQPFIRGRKPSWADFRHHIQQVAGVIYRMQHSAEIRSVLPRAYTECYNLLGLNALSRLRHRWDTYKTELPTVAGWVDESLDQLAWQVERLKGTGTLIAHNDICNANWLVTTDEHIYLIDLDSMSLDDPAQDLGALLWWYYPPELRGRFLELAGYHDDEQLRVRMRLRMAMHCLSILLPREGSYDCFQADKFIDSLTDFRAILSGEENPQGYV